MSKKNRKLETMKDVIEEATKEANKEDMEEEEEEDTNRCLKWHTLTTHLYLSAYYF
jgi:hypothetical protein